jgi:hypothetical protein
MFRCQLCGDVVPPGTPSQRIVVQSRRTQYPYRSKANVVVRKPESGRRRKTKKEYRDDPGGEGHEIVREVIVCPNCVARNGSQ